MAPDFDDLAAEYAKHRRISPGLIEHILEQARVTADSAVLEVGCGTAIHLAAVRRATGARCVGVDPSARMLWHAAAHPEELDLRQGNAEELDFPAETFDLIMAIDMLHYVREPRRYFRRAFTALKPGGLLVTVTDSDWVIRNRIPLSYYFPATVDVELGRYHPIPALAGDMALLGFTELHERIIESSYLLYEATMFQEKWYSCLRLIGDEELAAGIKALKSDLERGPIQANLRSVALWGRRGRNDR